jgi:hypothetical protein
MDESGGAVLIVFGNSITEFTNAQSSQWRRDLKERLIDD